MMSLRLCLVVLVLVSVPVTQAATNLSCNESCGNVSICFPFGISADCFLNPWFEIDCKVPRGSKGSPKPLLSKLQIEVKMINFNLSEYTTHMDKYLTVLLPPTNSCTPHQSSVDLRGSPFHFSQGNVFVVEDCPGNAVMVNESKQVLAGCGTTCAGNGVAASAAGCNGVKCCHDRPDLGYLLQLYQVDFDTQSQNCLLATLASPGTLDQVGGRLSSAVPAQLSWVWSNYTFKKAVHSTCFIDDTEGMICNCDGGYQGNPYLADGCQVSQGCQDCSGYCYEDYNFPHCYEEVKEKKPLFTLAASLGMSISFGMILVVFGFYGLYRFVRRRREMKRRAKFFKRNGGLLMQQQLSTTELTKIFTPAELDKATDHFSENRILGQGGQGTVYKGMLADGRIVAIKKSKLVDKSQVEHFINEVVILSQINHRNVVRLLGCCLETEVPLLVYEFIPNGTLSQHLHHPYEEEGCFMSWMMRLKIAADSASAIAYLHSSSSTPVYHRDIKSANILLNERYRARVSDFGCSKTIAVDQTHLTTLVQGTWGYLDPEYFQSSQFTEKSDVYSFGVVLLELLTSKKPIYKGETNEHKSLVIEFQNSQVFNMVDQEVAKEVKEEDLTAVLELTKRCLCWNGKLRPTMKEVAMTLEMIVKSQAQESTFNKQGSQDEYGEDVILHIS